MYIYMYIDYYFINKQDRWIIMLGGYGWKDSLRNIPHIIKYKESFYIQIIHQISRPFLQKLIKLLMENKLSYKFNLILTLYSFR